jgi:chromosome segregation ATPase
MCHVKRLYVDQGRTVNQLTRNVTALTQEVDRLKAAIEVLKIEKRHLEQAWQTVSAERDNISVECERLHERLDNTEAEILLVTE